MKRSYKEGEIVVGRVTGVKEYGVFVKLDRFHKGLIHISCITRGYVKDINDYVKINELIRVKVISSVDEEMLKLSIKDIDYRITNRHNSKIIETPSGFGNLALHLDYWLEKEKEALKNKKNI